MWDELKQHYWTAHSTEAPLGHFSAGWVLMCWFGKCRLTGRMQAVGGNPADGRGFEVSIATALNTHFTLIPDVKCLRQKGDPRKCADVRKSTRMHIITWESFWGLDVYKKPPTHVQIWFSDIMLLFHLINAKHSPWRIKNLHTSRHTHLCYSSIMMDQFK